MRFGWIIIRRDFQYGIGTVRDWIGTHERAHWNPCFKAYCSRRVVAPHPASGFPHQRIRKFTSLMTPGIGNRQTSIIRTDNVCEASHILILITVDGVLLGINRNDGTLLWETSTNNAVNEQLINDAIENSLFLPDPVEGTVYHFDTELGKLQKLSVSIKNLVSQPAYITNDGKFHTSTQSTEIMALDPFTGQIEVADDISDSGVFKNSVFITKTHYVMNIQKASKRNRYLLL